SFSVSCIQYCTFFLYPSRPRCFMTAYVAAVEAPLRVPVRVNCALVVRYGVFTLRESRKEGDLNSRAPDGIVESPILCGSIAMEVTPETLKSNGCGFSRNGITNPPKAASM